MRAIGTSVLSLVGGLDKVFIIPPFQRNYDWSYDQCDELFDDIVKAYKTNTTHYLGNIVYYMGKNSGASFNELILVDGQQRITTILLLLCAIRDYSKQEDLKINSRYLINDTDIEKFRIKLIPFIKGSLKFFNNYTNIELNRKLIVADVYELGEENMKYGMYLFTELFWDKIKINRKIKKLFIWMRYGD